MSRAYKNRRKAQPKNRQVQDQLLTPRSSRVKELRRLWKSNRPMKKR